MAELSTVIIERTSGRLETKWRTVEVGEVGLGMCRFKKFEAGGKIRKRKYRGEFRHSTGAK